ncbi:glycoside hydrolase family 3 N-terminal domain-containing protein [Agromyces albus]|uniref:Beta-glucosidase n=1 Tax=Agromyces albus TaxID=205332 RepID=A0A4Q2KUF9_9MICO|nr:glycoside hydrolase family 3 N-terminal domain-containing protein [Agromyces albus]RXZ67041.1 beta-glucosidase [Agromyces albus]
MLKSPTERANELVARMTLAEKAQQVTSIMPFALFGENGLDAAALDRHLASGIGHISAAASGSDPQQIAGTVNEIQRYLVERTRLGIPAIMHAEALNGFVAAGYTSFPTAIGLAASWDPARVEAMAEVIRRQMRSVGVLQALAPVLDVARDARWGRVHETYGEDVYLVSAFSVAFVRGLQGQDLTGGVLATGKHFLGYGLTEAGQNMAATHLGPRELYDVYATPFEAAIKMAGMGSVMNSYSEIDGVPVGANRGVLTDLLRGRMGFTGSVVSDYGTVDSLHTRQGVASSLSKAGELALAAGLDVELPVASGYKTLEDSIREGRLEEAVLDDAVRRVLVDKFKLGLFENPYASNDPIELSTAQSEGAALSRELADESVTLLKNDGKLPLAKSGRIAVIGPHADSAMVNFAAYTYPAVIDMVKGLSTGESRMAGLDGMMDSRSAETAETAQTGEAQLAQLMEIDSEDVARHVYGTKTLVEAIRAAAPDAIVESVEGVSIHPDDPQDIEAAVALAQEADVVILAIGGKAGWFGTRVTEGEGSDAARVELPDHQVALVDAVSATGTPLVGVLYQGRPIALSEVEPKLDALVTGYYPGPNGSGALAAVLFGDTNPSGKLPYSMPRATGQLPLYVSQKRGSGYQRTASDTFSYIDLDITPLFYFGHGLSYTTFEYGDLELAADEVPTEGGSIVVSVELRNTGDRDGTEVVQLYAAQHATGVTRPAQQLIGFTRVSLAAGESTTVRFTVPTSQLGYSGLDGRFILEPGPISLAVGGSSDKTPAQGTVELTGAVVDLEGRRTYLNAADLLVQTTGAAR